MSPGPPSLKLRRPPRNAVKAFRQTGSRRLAEAAREIAGPAGPLEVLIDVPAGAPRAAVVFAHPLPTHGGTMHTKVVFQSAKALTRIGCAVLRFNFRGVGRSAGAWDEGRGEKEDFRAALDFLAARDRKSTRLNSSH